MRVEATRIRAARRTRSWRPQIISNAVRDTLRNLAVGDAATITRILSGGSAPGSNGLDPRSVALLRLAALVAVDGDITSFEHEASAALACGATPDQLVGVLEAVGPITGSSRLVAAAGKLALPIGYDLEADLEGMPIEPGPAHART